MGYILTFAVVLFLCRLFKSEDKNTIIRIDMKIDKDGKIHIK